MNRVPKPPELSDGLMLPFAAWRIIDLIDGQRNVDQIALLLGITSEQAAKQVDTVFQMIERLEQQTQLVDAATIDRVAKATMKVLGPWGKVAVDDALDVLGDSVTLVQLLNQLLKDMDDGEKSKVVLELRDEGLI